MAYYLGHIQAIVISFSSGALPLLESVSLDSHVRAGTFPNLHLSFQLRLSDATTSNGKASSLNPRWAHVACWLISWVWTVSQIDVCGSKGLVLSGQPSIWSSKIQFWCHEVGFSRYLGAMVISRVMIIFINCDRFTKCPPGVCHSAPSLFLRILSSWDSSGRSRPWCSSRLLIKRIHVFLYGSKRRVIINWVIYWLSLLGGGHIFELRYRSLRTIWMLSQIMRFIHKLVHTVNHPINCGHFLEIEECTVLHAEGWNLLLNAFFLRNLDIILSFEFLCVSFRINVNRFIKQSFPLLSFSLILQELFVF